jgi:hypothetical protein
MRLTMTADASSVRDVSSSPAPAERSLFDGLDTSIAAIGRVAGLPEGALQQELQRIGDLARRALDDYEPLQPGAIVPTLASGLRAVREARAALRDVTAPAAVRSDADFLLSRKEEEFTDALTRAAAVVVDALADQETVPQGSTVNVGVRAFYPDGSVARVTAARVVAPRRWTVAPAAAPRAGAGPGAERPNYQQDFSVSVPADADVTQPYFLASAKDGDRYQWTGEAPKGRPFAAGPLVAEVSLDVGGAAVIVERRVDYRYADRVRGEVRRNVNVVPPLTVAVDSPLLIVPLGQRNPHRVMVTTTNHLRQPTTAVVRLQLPAGWTSTPPQAAAAVEGGGRQDTAFVVTPPARAAAGRVEITATAAAAGATYAREMQTIAYPHIETHRIYRTSSVGAQVLDVKVAPVKVGYVMGSGDLVPEALQRLGVDVTLLDVETMARGDLSRFDTIVVGVRASEARPDFAAEHARLMQYVTRGGTLVVQYQQLDYLARNLPPYPGAPPQGAVNSRITDETAPVTILAPAHPVFTFPNRITAADFEGWVQERNLYAFPQPDPRYTRLLETVDPGEPPQRGAEVYARIGKGHYVYTAFSWFRQLPAGVPGAYRQFANLISLPKAPL